MALGTAANVQNYVIASCIVSITASCQFNFRHNKSPLCLPAVVSSRSSPGYIGQPMQVRGEVVTIDSHLIAIILADKYQ